MERYHRVLFFAILLLVPPGAGSAQPLTSPSKCPATCLPRASEPGHARVRPAALSVSKVKYLGRDIIFGVGFDDANPYVHQGHDNLQVYTDYLLNDLMVFAEHVRFTSFVVPMPDVTPPFEEWFRMDSHAHQVSWVYRDLEYDYRNTVQLHGLTHQWNWECGHEFDPICQNGAPSYLYTRAAVVKAMQAAKLIYETSIGRQPLAWKFPGYREGPYGVEALTAVFPIVVQGKNEGSDEPSITGRRILLHDHMPVVSTMPSRVTDNYLVAGHGTLVWNSDYDSMESCSNFIWCDRYRNRLKELMDYAEWQAAVEGIDVLHVDYSEIGEITDMYLNAALGAVDSAGFYIRDDTSYPYRKRLGINITGGFTSDRRFVRIVTPSGMGIAQSMIQYHGGGENRHALATICVEDGYYRVLFVEEEPEDPILTIRELVVSPGCGSHEPARLDYSIAWSGAQGIWGEYAAGNGFVHGFGFSDERWVEKDVMTGELHVLGPSGCGVEAFEGRMPFSYYCEDASECGITYVVDASFMWRAQSEAVLRMPERYHADWILRVTHPDGSVDAPPLVDLGSGIAFRAAIQPQGVTVIEYKRGDWPEDECGLARQMSVLPIPSGISTTIVFRLAGCQPTWLEVYDPIGRKVRTLARGQLTLPGERGVVWDHTDDRGHDVGKGIYFVTLDTPEGRLTKRVVVVR